MAMVVRLSEGKLQQIAALVQEWGNRRTCSARELQSLIGVLQWASRVVRHGRTFLQRMYDLLLPHADTCTPFDSSAIELDGSFTEDLAWWSSFLQQWNGVTLITDQE